MGRVRPVVRPCVYSPVYEVTSYGGADDGPIELDLTSSATIDSFLPAISYARNSAMNVLDFEELLKTDIPVDNVAGDGGRNVTNKFLWSQDISNVAWTNNFNSVTATTFLATAQYQNTYQKISTVESDTLTLSYVLSTQDGSNYALKFKHKDSTSGSYTDVTISGTPTRYSISFGGLNGGGEMEIGLIDWNTTGFKTVNATNFQIEKTTGQTNQNPSEYIATTDSVATKYYNTENGNTVASNVVIEATGDPLTNTIGVAFWPSTTNVVPALSYRDFTHANWTPANGSITAGDVVLIDGTTVSDKNTLTASGANCTLIHDAYTSASGVHAAGLFVKRKTGTGDVDVTVDGGSTWVTKTIASDSWTNIQTTLPTVTDPQIGVRLVTSGDAVYLDLAQMDDGYARISAHPIAGGATLALGDMHHTNENHIKAEKGSILVEFIALPDYSAFINDSVILGNGDCEIRAEALTSGVSFNDGTNDTVGCAGTPSGLVKAVIVWEGSEVKITTINGTTTGTYVGNLGAETIYIGRNSTGNALPGGVKNVTYYYNQALSDVEAAALVN